MAHFFHKLTTLLLILALFFSVFAINVGATAREEIDLQEKIICVVHRGDWHSFPENSAEAVKSGGEYGFVSVDIRLTKDNKAVLMADETTDRMVVDGQGKTVSGDVAEKTLSELTSLYLRAGNGGEDKAKTDYRVAGLEAAISSVSEDSLIILNTFCADFETVYSEVKSLGAEDKVMFRFNSDSNADIIETTSGRNDVVSLGNYQGNIIFMATSAVNDTLENGMNIIELGSANENGVLYDDYLMERFQEKGKAMVSMVNGRSGERPDNERGWDDLIGMGYSVIETDYPEQFSQYLEQVERERESLGYYVDLYKSTDMQPYTTDSETAFTSALSEATILLSQASSLSELQNSRFALQSAYDNLTLGEKKAVTLKFEFTAGRVIALVLCGGAIIATQIFFFKKRDKSKKAQ